MVTAVAVDTVMAVMEAAATVAALGSVPEEA